MLQPQMCSTRTQSYIPTCTDLMTMAERELTGFFNAAKGLLGAEQARAAGALLVQPQLSRSASE